MYPGIFSLVQPLPAVHPDRELKVSSIMRPSDVLCSDPPPPPPLESFKRYIREYGDLYILVSPSHRSHGVALVPVSSPTVVLSQHVVYNFSIYPKALVWLLQG